MKVDNISALIRLIDDPDEEVYQHIKSQLLTFGEEVIPSLEDYWEAHEFGDLFHHRVEDIIQLIRFENTKVALTHWMTNQPEDLLEGILILNRYSNPNLDADAIRTTLDNLRRDVWLELNESLTAFEKINVVNHVLFDLHNFSGNKANYHSPQNSFFDKVLEQRKGNPLSLSTLYLLICQDLDIPVYGVNLPNHFLLSYMEDRSAPLSVEGMEGMLQFYINPFSKGAILHRPEIDAFLHQLNLDKKPNFYEPCSHSEILARFANNLNYAYTKAGATRKASEMKALYDLLLKA